MNEIYLAAIQEDGKADAVDQIWRVLVKPKCIHYQCYGRNRHQNSESAADHGARRGIFLELPVIPYHPSPLPQANYRMNLVPR